MRQVFEARGRNIIMRARVSSHLIHKRNDRVRQMIRKLRNIVPLPGNIGMFRKDPLCIMHVGLLLKRTGCTRERKRYLFEAGIIMNQPRVRGWKFKERDCPYEEEYLFVLLQCWESFRFFGVVIYAFFFVPIGWFTMRSSLICVHWHGRDLSENEMKLERMNKKKCEIEM